MREILAIASLVLSVGAGIPYIIEIVQGKVKPERVSWLIWTMLGLTYFVSAVISDGAVIFTSGELVGPAIILLLSLKFGVGGRSRMDKYSLAAAIIAFVLLIISEDVIISLLLALFIDAIAAVLTIRKLIIDPASESRLAWAITAVAGSLAVISLDKYSLENILFPAYVALVSLIIAIMSNPNKEKNIRQIEKL